MHSIQIANLECAMDMKKKKERDWSLGGLVCFVIILVSVLAVSAYKETWGSIKVTSSSWQGIIRRTAADAIVTENSWTGHTAGCVVRGGKILTAYDIDDLGVIASDEHAVARCRMQIE